MKITGVREVSYWSRKREEDVLKSLLQCVRACNLVFQPAHRFLLNKSLEGNERYIIQKLLTRDLSEHSTKGILIKTMIKMTMVVEDRKQTLELSRFYWPSRVCCAVILFMVPD